jgi:hypothetical protein
MQLQQETAAAKQQTVQQQEALADQQAQLADRDKRLAELQDKLRESQTKTAEQVGLVMTRYIDLQQCMVERQALEQKLLALATAQEKSAELTAELASAGEENARLLSKLTALRVEVDKAKACCKETESLTAEFEEQVVFGDNRIAALTKDKQELTLKVSSLTKTLEGSKQLYLQLQQENEELAGAIESMDQVHASEKDAIQKQLTACQTQNASLRNLLKQK